MSGAAGCDSPGPMNEGTGELLASVVWRTDTPPYGCQPERVCKGEHSDPGREAPIGGVDVHARPANCHLCQQLSKDSR